MSEITWSAWDLHVERGRARFVATFRRDGEVVRTEQFDVAVPVEAPIQTDEMGRYLTRSGDYVLPQVLSPEGAWVPRGEDPQNPWVRSQPHRDVNGHIERAMAAYAEQAGL